MRPAGGGCIPGDICSGCWYCCCGGGGGGGAWLMGGSITPGSGIARAAGRLTGAGGGTGLTAAP